MNPVAFGEAALALEVGQQRFRADERPEHSPQPRLAEFIGAAGLTFAPSAREARTAMGAPEGKI